MSVLVSFFFFRSVIIGPSIEKGRSLLIAPTLTLTIRYIKLFRDSEISINIYRKLFPED